MQNFPIVRWALRHPRLAAWIVLAAFMCGLLAIEARDVGLLPTQWLALFTATTLVAGLCVWIISWEDTSPDEAQATTEVEAVRVSPPDSKS